MSIPYRILTFLAAVLYWFRFYVDAGEASKLSRQ